MIRCWSTRTSTACPPSERPSCICGALMAARCSTPTSNASSASGHSRGRWTWKATADVARIDYLDDPAAPKATSIVPAVSVVVPDDQGRILLIHRTDNKYWSIPGGGMEPGESVREAAMREVKEETGMDCEIGRASCR